MKCDNSTNFFEQSSRTRVDLLSYESKMTDKLQLNDWRAKKNLDVKEEGEEGNRKLGSNDKKEVQLNTETNKFLRFK